MSIKWEEPGVGGLLSERTFIVSVLTSSYIFQNKSSCASFNRTIKWQYQCSESTLCGQKFADTCWCAAVTASNLFPAVRRFIFQIMFEVNKLFFMEVNTEITSLSDYSVINLFFSVKYWTVSPLQVSGDQWNSQTLKLCGEVTHRYCIIIRVLEGLDVVVDGGGLRNQHFWPRHSPEWSQRATDRRDASGNLNHHLPLKHSRPFYISVFSWQYVRSVCLHLCGLKFSFSPASFTGSSCLLLKTCTSWFCCLITKAFKWLNNGRLLIWRVYRKSNVHQISRVLLAANLQ